MKPTYKITLPEYIVNKKPDFDFCGAKIDSLLRKHYLGQNIVIRALGSQEHSEKTPTELVKIIQDSGTDRYDPGREGEKYENIEQKHIDFFALPFLVTRSGEYFKFLIEPFYTYPDKPVRIDIAIIYDPTQLEIVEHHYEGREEETKRDGYVFKDHSRKQDALMGIILIN